MSEFSTPLGGGMRVRETDLDANGAEIERSVVVVPHHLEAADVSLAQRQALIDGFCADIKAKGAELALLRADARIAGVNPDAAEKAFTAVQRGVASAAPVQGGS